MTRDDTWSGVGTELDRWTSAGLDVRLWLRDDDAIAATPALAELLNRCSAHAVAALLAVIPMLADTSLQRALGRHSAIEIGVHGIAHENHAPPGRKSEELAPERGRDDILGALRPARARLIDTFGAEAGNWYVPPWNRISPAVAGWLPELGFQAVSTFGPPHLGASPKLIEANTHLDIIDWKGGRVGRPIVWVAAEFERQLALARTAGGHPVGVLTHHLVHDAGAWQALDGLFAATCGHPAVRWITPHEVLARLAPAA
jgi:hypothetical protein